MYPRIFFEKPFEGQSLGYVCLFQLPLKVNVYLASPQAQQLGISVLSTTSSILKQSKFAE